MKKFLVVLRTKNNGSCSFDLEVKNLESANSYVEKIVQNGWVFKFKTPQQMGFRYVSSNEICYAEVYPDRADAQEELRRRNDKEEKDAKDRCEERRNRELYDGKLFYEVNRKEEGKITFIGPLDNIRYCVPKTDAKPGDKVYKYMQIIDGNPVQCFLEDEIFVTTEKL